MKIIKEKISGILHDFQFGILNTEQTEKTILDLFDKKDKVVPVIDNFKRIRASKPILRNEIENSEHIKIVDIGNVKVLGISEELFDFMSNEDKLLTDNFDWPGFVKWHSGLSDDAIKRAKLRFLQEQKK